MKLISFISISVVAWFGLLALTGCGGEEVAAPAPVVARPMPPLPKLEADAGVPVQTNVDPNFDRARTIASSKEFGRRSDPFSLLASERKFEREQQNERVIVEYGGWFQSEFVEPDTSAAERQSIVEPQPYRRLSGILLGNGVSALIEMEDGRVWEVVPGSQIPGTDWIVISIDAERAILRRGGSRLPKEIIVRLGPRADGFGGPAQGGGGGGDAPLGSESEGRESGGGTAGAQGRGRAR